MINAMIPMSGKSALSSVQNALSIGNQVQKQQINALAIDRAKSQQSQETAATLAQGVLNSDNPARDYPLAVQRAQALGMDVSALPAEWGPQAETMVSLFARPDAEQIELEREFQMVSQRLGPQKAMEWLAIERGLLPNANVRLQQSNQGFTLSPGQSRVSAGGQVVASVPDRPDKMPAGYFRKPDGTMDYIPGGPADPNVAGRLADARGRPTTTINVGPEGQQFPKPPSGTVWQRDQQGAIALDDRGAPIAIPFQGGQVMADQQAASDQAQVQQDLRNRSAMIITEDIDRAVDLIQNSSWPTTGILGTALSRIPASSANNVRALIDTIKGNAAFDKLQSMREASPTGGALGQVSNIELRLLSAAIGNLEQSQGQGQLLDNLARVRNLYLDIAFGAGSGPARSSVGFRQGDGGSRLEFLQAQYPDDAEKVMKIMKSEGLL